MGRGDPGGGRPPLDGKTRAEVFRVKEEHPTWGSRKIATAVGGVSHEKVRKLLKSVPGEIAHSRSQFAAAPVVSEPAWRLAWRAREMTPEDHLVFDAYTGPPASTWWWGSR